MSNEVIVVKVYMEYEIWVDLVIEGSSFNLLSRFELFLYFIGSSQRRLIPW